MPTFLYLTCIKFLWFKKKIRIANTLTVLFLGIMQNKHGKTNSVLLPQDNSKDQESADFLKNGKRQRKRISVQGRWRVKELEAEGLHVQGFLKTQIWLENGVWGGRTMGDEVEE